MISLGFILMGFGIAVPAIYWVIALLLFLIAFIIVFTIGPNKEGGDHFYGFSELIMVIFLYFIFPEFTLLWWMWLYFIIFGLMSLFTSIINN